MQQRMEGRSLPARGATGLARSAGGVGLVAAVALFGGTLLLAGAAGAAEMTAITGVDGKSPKTVAYECAGRKRHVVLELRADSAEDFYIQAAGNDVMIPVTCASATVGISASGATISCNKQVKGDEPMTAVDGVDLADALAKALGSSGCRRVK